MKAVKGRRGVYLNLLLLQTLKQQQLGKKMVWPFSSSNLQAEEPEQERSGYLSSFSLSSFGFIRLPFLQVRLFVCHFYFLLLVLLSFYSSSFGPVIFFYYFLLLVLLSFFMLFFFWSSYLFYAFVLLILFYFDSSSFSSGPAMSALPTLCLRLLQTIRCFVFV